MGIMDKIVEKEIRKETEYLMSLSKEDIILYHHKTVDSLIIRLEKEREFALNTGKCIIRDIVHKLLDCEMLDLPSICKTPLEIC